MSSANPTVHTSRRTKIVEREHGMRVAHHTDQETLLQPGGQTAGSSRGNGARQYRPHCGSGPSEVSPAS
jgi:hypothetical protein